MAKRESRTVSFTPEHDDFVSHCVESGRYQSASEVVRAGLRLLQHEDERRRAELERVRREIRVGAEQLERGETVEGEEVFRRWRAKHQDLRGQGSAG